MKKIIASICSLLLIGGLAAQSNVQRVYTPQTVESSEIIEETDRPTETAAQRVNVIYNETFANGFAGDGGGAWTTTDNSASGDTIWKFAPTEGTPPNFTAPLGTMALTSPTSGNGYAWFDAIGFTDQDNAFSLEGELISPSIDLTDEPSVVLEYYQKFAYCCYSYSPLQVEVSADGGGSWTTFPGEGTFLTDANTSSGNLQTTLDITCVAAGQSDVMIKFKWSEYLEAGGIGFPYYSWAIDDVSLCAAPLANDIVVSQITNGDVFNIWEYRHTPIQQAVTAADGGMLVGVMFLNKGTADQENVVFDIDILDEAGTEVISFSSDPMTIPSSANDDVCPNLGDTLYFNTGFYPSETGKYVIDVSVAGDVADEVPDDNTMQRAISFDDATYGHEDRDNLDLEYRAQLVEGEYNIHGYGNFFTVPYEGSVANGITVRFGPNTDIGMDVEARLYELEGVGEINPFLENFGSNVVLYTVEAEDVALGALTYIEFEDEWDLSPEFIYFVTVNTTSVGDEEMTVLGESVSDSDNSSRIIALTGGDQEDWWFGDRGTPAVRLVMDNEPPLSIEEFDVLDVDLGLIVPNPVKDHASVFFNLKESMKLEFKILDLQGRVVYEKSLGELQAGEHQLDVNASDLAEGVYKYSLISSHGRIAKSMMVTK